MKTDTDMNLKPAGGETPRESVLGGDQPPAAEVDRSSYSGAMAIACERARQMREEGWSPAHDDKHRGKQLALAAESYLATHTSPDVDHPRTPAHSAPCWNWPWSRKWWKPAADPVRNLVKAGALIAAEIDRLNRARAKNPKS